MDFGNDYRMLIDGALVTATRRIEVVNPATGNAFASAPDGSEIQLDEAVHAARRAFKAWRAVSIEDRQALVARAGDILAVNVDDLARLFTREQGRLVKGACQEILGTANWAPCDREDDAAVSRHRGLGSAVHRDAIRFAGGGVRDLAVELPGQPVDLEGRARSREQGLSRSETS